jgi:hypothetical protein
MGYTLGRFFTRSLALTAAAGSLFLAALASPAQGWDAVGHRLITMVALDRFTQTNDLPRFLREGNIRNQIADGATVPDRYRSMKMASLKHVNDVDHYLDIEDLVPYGLDLQSISPLRHEYVGQLVRGRMAAGEKFAGRPVNPLADVAKTLEYPGFLPHAIVENYAKLRCMFQTLRILEALNEPRRQDQIDLTRSHIIVQMGIISHFVGDAAQPLHTTKHFNGWIGENPEGYTTDRKFHAYIDGGLITYHKIGYDQLKDNVPPFQELNGKEPWQDVLLYINRSHEFVPELYRMQKAGELEGVNGYRLVVERMTDASAFLAALYQAAWENSVPTDADVADFVKWDGLPAAEEPGHEHTAPKP